MPVLVYIKDSIDLCNMAYVITKNSFLDAHRFNVVA